MKYEVSGFWFFWRTKHRDNQHNNRKEPQEERPIINQTPPEEVKPIDELKPVITYDTVTTNETEPFSPVYVEDASLDRGTEVITQYGVNGIRTITSYVTYTDGTSGYVLVLGFN